MNLIFTIILGAVQGITEFLPISSSGHLILFRSFLNFEGNYGLAVDAVLQLATTFAILIYFHKDIFEITKNFFKKSEKVKNEITVNKIIIASIPVVVVGLLIEGYMDTIFRNYLLVAGTLIVGSIIMLVAEKLYKNKNNLNLKNSLIIGLFQVLSLIPGMSRSGMTISGALFSGISRETATKFSFIVAFPVLFGSGLKKLLDLYQDGYLFENFTELFLGASAAFFVGLMAIHFLVRFLKNNKMNIFAYYRIFIAGVIIFIAFFRN
jgi:undecaprenyl-diphosphatase